MSLIDIRNLALEAGNLKAKTEGACLKAAYDIINEDPVTANHTNRIAWARDVLLDFQLEAGKMYLTVLSNVTIQINGNNSTDNDVQYVVNSLINQFATG
jgi:hypothetical protein